MNNKTCYLDNSFLSNPNFSKKFNAFNRIFTPIVSVLYLAFILYLIIKKSDLTKIPYLIHGGVLVGVIVTQSIIYKKYGRKFLQCTEDSLILKHKYFEKSS